MSQIIQGMCRETSNSAVSNCAVLEYSYFENALNHPRIVMKEKRAIFDGKESNYTRNVTCWEHSRGKIYNQLKEKGETKIKI